uniref:Ig-like domain-containing protein n=1 Tax=Sinocyclocheilus anshuiensis TaxID=1608454 RepID=A0A671TEQ7_9TELE
MIIGWCFICVFAVLINKVSLDVRVVGFTGSSVVLPCSSIQHDLKPQDMHVLWRDKDSETIYDLIEGKDSLETQDPRYKNRAQTFPEEYERGNFSIKLSNLTHADEGEFNCFITHSSYSNQETVWLFINESTVETGNQSTEEENQVPETQSNWIKTLLICVCLLTLITSIIALSTVYFKFCRNKSHQAPI